MNVKRSFGDPWKWKQDRRLRAYLLNGLQRRHAKASCGSSPAHLGSEHGRTLGIRR